MNTLIILAHGSRRQESNQEIVTLVEKVKSISNNEYDMIEHAYLEIVEPNLPQCIDQAIKNGAKNITVFPYFLNSGNHVKRDIPAIIENAVTKYPDCNFNISAFIGMHKDIPQLVLQQSKIKM